MDNPIIQLAAETGIRRSETFELRWKHMNLDCKTAHLSSLVETELSRTALLSQKAIQLLKNWSRRCADESSPP